MANEKRLIYLEDAYEAVTDLSGQAETKSAYAAFWKAGKELEKLPTVDAAPVVHGWWKEYSHSALVSWKNGEPVWADRAVYRCSGCDFGTIIKHNYCPRCGANMMDGERRAET